MPQFGVARRFPWPESACPHSGHMSAMENTNFKGRVALVSGGSLGIGRAACVALARAGAHVAVNFRDHDEEASQVVQAIRDSGSQAIKVQADVADQRAVDQMVSEVVDHFGKLDIAIANAAYSARERFVEADLDEFRKTVDITMWGSFYLTRAAAREMIRLDNGGVIVLVSSPHSFMPMANSMAYNMSKAAMEIMGKTAALELAEQRIRVNIVQPGWIDTPGERKFASPETLKRAGRRLPFKRLGTPEEIAKAIVFLSDPSCEYMTGATLLVDGGISLPWWASGAEIS
jgi:glucose 1-dehydrogenase